MSDPITYRPRQHLSISTLLDFVRCPRRYFYRKCGLQQKEQSGAPAYGSAMHKAVPLVLSSGLDAGIEAFCTLWDDSLADEKRSLKRAKAQLSHFAHTHEKGRSLYSFEAPPRSPDIEITEDLSPFEVPAFIDIGLPVPLFLRMDGLVKHRDTGDLWGWEFKTVSGYGWTKIFENLEVHPQILAYTLAFRTVTGLPVRGMIAEAMLIDKTKVDNMSQPILVPDHQVTSIMRWLQYYGSMLLAAEAKYEEIEAQEPGAGARAFVQNFGSCSAYPFHYLPSWPCDFMNLCRVDDWRKMASFYDVVPEHQVVKLVQPTIGASNV